MASGKTYNGGRTVELPTHCNLETPSGQYGGDTCWPPPVLRYSLSTYITQMTIIIYCHITSPTLILVTKQDIRRIWAERRRKNNRQRSKKLIHISLSFQVLRNTVLNVPFSRHRSGQVGQNCHRPPIAYAHYVLQGDPYQMHEGGT